MRRKKNKLPVIIGILLVIAIIAAAYLFIQLRDEKEQTAQLEDTITANTLDVYVATRDILAGEVIQAEGEGANVELRTIYSGIGATYYISEEDIGSVAIVDIAADSPVMANMYTTKEISTDTRNYEIATAELMTNLEEYDFVDVRVSFPTGEDYLVLSKKEVGNLHLSNCVFTTQLTELEILRLNSAIMDVYTTPGARMYVTAYVESNIQDAGDITYPMLTAAASLAATDTNVSAVELSDAIDSLNTTARLALETRLEGITEDDATNITSGNDEVDSTIEEIMEEQKQKEEEELEMMEE